MAIIKYNYDYDFHEASAFFLVDTKKFTPEMALSTLNFFDWDWDEDEEPVYEVMKKYAIEAIRQATIHNHNAVGVIEDFKNLEGFAPIDGSMGIHLMNVEPYQFEDDKLSLIK